ncbi:response regulator [Cryobacterium serini]|uniref:Response regulator n=1 Tax=Cryobacterium serini TaxID=1259201 RepID=A0A4R9BTL9_9MICO|nr:response regulator [Cryobacterium serini]TFD90743.1 response regulator [Cryobacterium serini]
MARILIIEDNPINMKLATLLVNRAGHTTSEAVDAESGLLLARNELPDLILMDIQLPGMDGYAATALLKSDPATAEIPVIALTAMAMSRDQDRARQAACDAYITRPLHYQELQDAINWLLPRADDEDASEGTSSIISNGSSPMESSSGFSVRDRLTVEDFPTGKRAMTLRAPDATRILVAGGNPTQQKLILWQLNLLGYEADLADNGALALELWTTGDYHLLITDLQMPQMNAFELAAAIRATEGPGVHMPILAMTVSAVHGDADYARRVGMNDYLIRPLHLAKLRAALLKWLPLESDHPH